MTDSSSTMASGAGGGGGRPHRGRGGGSPWQDQGLAQSGGRRAARRREESQWRGEAEDEGRGQAGGAGGGGAGKGGGRGGQRQREEERCGRGGLRRGGRTRRGTTLFVRNLPGNVGVEALDYVFANYGKVVKICVMNGRSPDFKACAFIKYLFSCEAALAVQMLHGKYEMQPGHGPIAVKADAPGVFVENLPADIPEEMLDYVFSFYGQVLTVHITTGHSRSGRARAFVEYSSAAEAETATAALHEGQDLPGAAGLGAAEPAAEPPAEPPAADEADAAAGPPGAEDLPGAFKPPNGGGSEPMCVVCLASPKTHAFVPCGHRCVCADCGDTVLAQATASEVHATCPICRALAERVLQIFC